MDPPVGTHKCNISGAAYHGHQVRSGMCATGLGRVVYGVLTISWLALLRNMQLVCVPTLRRRSFEAVLGTMLGKEWVLSRACRSADCDKVDHRFVHTNSLP